MQITALEPQPRAQDRWNVYVDGAFALALDGALVVREQLSPGVELSEADLTRLRAAAQEQDLLSAALRFLAPRPRSRAEVRRRLLRPRPHRAAPDAAAIERVLERLTELGVLDDRDFADFWVENRERFGPRSARAMGMELRQRGVARETVEAAADPERDEERALAAVRQKQRAFSGLDYQAFREKVGAFLVRRGFSYDVARTTVRALWEEMGAESSEDDADEQESM
jgi:regulatory protein